MYQGLNQAQKKMTAFQKNVNGIMGKVASIFATVKIGETIKNSVQDAMSVETSLENLNRTLGENSKAFQQWANSQSQAYGMSKQEAFKYGSTFSNLISSFQSDTNQLANSTQELMKVTSIVSSKTGRTFEDTAERIRSGLLGSTEAIEDLGLYTQVSMLESTEAFAKFANGKSWQQLDFQTQQQIRLAAILEQAYARYGDTLADTTQSRHNQFIASLKNVQLALGQAFLPIYNAVLPPLTTLMNKLAKAISYISAFTTALFGKPTQAKQQTNAIKEQSGAISGVSDSLSDASKNLNKTATSAKKAKKEIGGLIGGLDEINNLSVSTTAGTDGTSGDTSSGVSTPTTGGLANLEPIDMGSKIDVSGLEEKAEKVKKAIEKIKTIIYEHKDAIIAGMVAIGTALALIAFANKDKVIENLANTFPRLTNALKGVGSVASSPFKLIAQGIGALASMNPYVAAAIVILAVLAGTLTYLWRTNETFRDKVTKVWKDLKDALEPWVEGFIILFKTLADVVKTVLGVAFKILWGIISSIVEVLTGEMIDELEDLIPIIKDLGEKFKGFAQDVEKGWKKVKKYFEELNKIFENEGFFAGAGKLLTDVGKWIIQGLLDGMVWALSGIAKFLADNIFKPIVEGIKKLFDIHSPSRVMMEIGEFIIEGLKNGMLGLLKKLPNDIVEKLKEFKDKVVNFFKDLKKEVEKQWEKVKNGVKDFVVDIKSKVDDFKKKVKEKWEESKKYIKDKTLDIKSKFVDTKEKLKQTWNNLTSGIKDKTANIKANIATKVNDFKNGWNNLVNNAKDKTANVKANIATKATDLKNGWNNLVSNVKDKTGNMWANIATKANDLKNGWNNLTSSVKDKTGNMKANVATAWSTLYNNWKNLTSSVQDKTGNMRANIATKVNDIKNGWNNLANNFKDKLVEFKVKISTAAADIKKFVNEIIRSVNTNLIAKLSINIPFFGKVSVPKIPYLARGGIIDSPTLAMVGEAGRKFLRSIVEIRYKKYSVNSWKAKFNKWTNRLFSYI